MNALKDSFWFTKPMIHRVKNLPKVEIDMIDYNDSVGVVRVYQVSGVLHLPNRLEQILETCCSGKKLPLINDMMWWGVNATALDKCPLWFRLEFHHDLPLLLPHSCSCLTQQQYFEEADPHSSCKTYLVLCDLVK